jgi:Flp pilus assembly pilin Flp
MSYDLVKKFLRDEDGAAAVEYAILVAVIGGVVVAALAAFDLDGIYTSVSTKVKAVITGIT